MVVLTSNGSLIPLLDNFMSELCYTQPCSNETLDTAAQAIIAGCSADLEQSGLPESVVTEAFGGYPLVREILCLKTYVNLSPFNHLEATTDSIHREEPYTEESYGGFLGAPPVAIDSGVYNSTEGYFCVTSLLTQLSAYFGAEPTVPYLTGLLTGANQTALDLATSIEANIICNDCIFAAAAIVDLAYPDAGNVPFDAIFALFNMTSPLPEGTTINEFANDTCAYEDRSVSTGKSFSFPTCAATLLTP